MKIKAKRRVEQVVAEHIDADFTPDAYLVVHGDCIIERAFPIGERFMCQSNGADSYSIQKIEPGSIVPSNWEVVSPLRAAEIWSHRYPHLHCVVCYGIARPNSLGYDIAHLGDYILERPSGRREVIPPARFEELYYAY